MKKLKKSEKSELLVELADQYGFGDILDFLEEYAIDSICPGICKNGCGYSTEVEPDQTEGWCEECETNSVISGMVLAEVM